MTEPRTEAGRLLLGSLDHERSLRSFGLTPPTLSRAAHVTAIIAIEAEAVAAYREQVRAAVEGLLNEFAGVTPDTAAGHEQFGAFHGVEVTRSAVLALLDAPPDAP